MNRRNTNRTLVAAALSVALTAVAAETSEIVAINEHMFLFLVHETPTFALQVMRSLSHMIRDLDEATSTD